MNKKDVILEYQDTEAAKAGTFIVEEGYNKSIHPEEIEMAEWIFSKLGGNMVLLTETNSVYMGKRPDYLWNDKYWELKTAHSSKSVDSLLRKALQQIRDNPGGVILNIEKTKDSIERIESAVDERIRKSCRFGLDVLIIRNHRIEKAIRYKK